MPRRIQSPSSINTYNKCPRKYYYQYIKGLKTLPSIHMTRGKIVHAVLDRFFNWQPNDINWENSEQEMRLRIQKLLVEEWKKSANVIKIFNLSTAQEMLYFEESLIFLINWLEGFIARLNPLRGSTFQEAFAKLTPILREKGHVSKKHAVRGFIDAIEEFENEISIIDYKTSKNTCLEEHKLQLAIYVLLYSEVHGKMPTKTGIHFLRENKPRFLPVDNELLDFAKREIALVHGKTESSDICDYPKKESILCKWSEGKCDFFDFCQKE